MSILIKGIDMPKDYVLRIEIEPNGTVWEEGRDWIKHRQSAIQIDRPHGRIIDEKEVAKQQIFHGEDEWSFDYYFVIMDDVEKVPTILEAEE